MAENRTTPTCEVQTSVLVRSTSYRIIVVLSCLCMWELMISVSQSALQAFEDIHSFPCCDTSSPLPMLTQYSINMIKTCWSVYTLCWILEEITLSIAECIHPKTESNIWRPSRSLRKPSDGQGGHMEHLQSSGHLLGRQQVLVAFRAA